MKTKFKYESNIINFLIKITKRKCPCCNYKVIIPLKFKKYDPYYCSKCNSHIEANPLLSIILTLSMLGLSINLGYIGFNILSILVLIVMFIRHLFLDILDAMILPLQEHI